MQQQSSYPVQFSVDYPDRPLNRLTTFFRLIVVIPIVILAGMLSGGSWSTDYDSDWVFNGDGAGFIAGAGLLFLPVLLMIVIRQKYPQWWFDWNLELQRFGNRIGAYVALLDDQYPSTDEHQSVHLDMTYPDVERDLNRWLPIVKWLLAIPHYFVLFFLTLAAIVAVVIAWFAILITGRYPRGLFNFVEGVMRWENRVVGYAVTLVTDEYPPFRLEP